MLSLTTGSSKEELEPGGDPGDLMSLLWPIHYGMLRFVGFDVLQPHVVHAPARLTDEERHQALESYAERLRGIREEEPMVVGLTAPNSCGTRSKPRRT